MKKLICLFLTLCLVVSVGIMAYPMINETIEAEESLVWNICSISEFAAGLESEDINVENSDAYNIYVLIKTKDVLPENTFAASNIPLDSGDIDRSLREHRENVKEYYSAYNGDIATALGLEMYTYFVGHYAPYIEIVFDDLSEYEKYESDIISSIENNANLLSSISTYALFEAFPEATVDNDYKVNYPITEAFDDIGISNSLYTGDGVTIGILDVNIPHITDNLKPGKYTLDLQEYFDDKYENNTHGTLVASIIGGTSGIAENAHLYCLNTGVSAFDDIRRLIAANVDIINMSLNYGAFGSYIEFDNYIDYTTSTTGCVFVISAGNEGKTSKMVTAPGCAMNAITVGSTNISKNIAESSSWYTTDSFLYKPDVVAPGGRLTGIPTFDDTINPPGGTSCAAPMVTGTIALLMEEFPMLKNNPALVKSLIHLGAEKLPSQSDYFDQQAGFGLINYQNMRECLLETRFYNFNILSTANADDIILSYTISIPALSEIRINTNSTINGFEEEEVPTPLIPVYTDYTIKVFDLTSQTYVASSTIDSSLDYLIYANESTTASSVRIDIVLESENVSGQEEKGTLAFELVHEHSWDSCIYLNKLSHQFVCVCGATGETGRHYVTGGNGINRFVPCAGCGYLLDMRDDIHQGIMSITQVSVNGSYIRSDGIVVLVDEDVEAYLAGTLQFYHPEDVPVTQ